MIGGKLFDVLSIILYRSLRADVIECAESIELPDEVYLQKTKSCHYMYKKKETKESKMEGMILECDLQTS